LLVASGALVFYGLKRGDYLLVPLVLSGLPLFMNGMTLIFPDVGVPPFPNCL
jgi:hypothetical protein